MRLTPTWRSRRSFSGVSVSGLPSTENSVAEEKRSSLWQCSMISASCSPESAVGVAPPKKTARMRALDHQVRAASSEISCLTAVTNASICFSTEANLLNGQKGQMTAQKGTCT